LFSFASIRRQIQVLPWSRQILPPFLAKECGIA
jgi:hypothetical protein